MTRMLIIGTGGIGRMIAQIIEDINREKNEWEVVGFIDDNPSLWGKYVGGIEVIGGINRLEDHTGTHLVFGFSNGCQKEILERKLAGSYPFATLIHPQAWISDRVEIGEGTVIYPGVGIDVDVTIGRHCLLNKNVTIGHDTEVGNFTAIAPGSNIGGSVKIGNGCEFGINSSTVQNIRIGEQTRIGAGACVIDDLPARCTAVGVPARPIRFHDF